MKKSNKKSNKNSKKSNNPLYSVYGARVSNSGEYINISLVNGEDDAKEWATACVKKKSKYIKVKVNEESIVLTIPRLDVDVDEDDDDDDDDDDESDYLSDEGMTPVQEDKLPF